VTSTELGEPAWSVRVRAGRRVPAATWVLIIPSLCAMTAMIYIRNLI